LHLEPDWFEDPASGRLLVVDRETGTFRTVKESLRGGGFEVEFAQDLREAQALLRGRRVDLILLGIEGGRQDYLRRAALLREFEPLAPVVVMAEGRGDLASEVIKLGAHDFLAKPIDPMRLGPVVAEGLRTSRQSRINLRLLRGVEEAKEAGVPFGVSPSFRRMLARFEELLDCKNPVLIVGEGGTGRESLARGFHRRRGEKGRFRIFHGRTLRKKEELRFLEERNEGGTVCIFEMREMSRRLQGTLASWHEWKRGASTREPDLILIHTGDEGFEPREGDWHPAFHSLLKETARIAVPPLRERREDLPFLATMVLDTLVGDLSHKGFTFEALMLLEILPWLGNLPELAKIVAKAWILAEGDPIGRRHLCGASEDLARAFLPARIEEGELLERLGRTHSKEADILPFEEEEKRILSRALEATEGNVSRAAELLRIGRATLYRKIHQYDLSTKRRRRRAGSPEA